MLLFTTDRTVVAKDLAAEIPSFSQVLGAKGLGIPNFRYRKEFFKYVSAQKNLRDDRSVSATTQIIDSILSENKENYAIPHSEITQLRVKLPRAWLRVGRVTFTTAQGEAVFRIAVPATKRSMPYLNPYPADWEFLKSPPPKLAGKLVVEGRA
jgi:hypothetical protein